MRNAGSVLALVLSRGWLRCFAWGTSAALVEGVEAGEHGALTAGALQVDGVVHSGGGHAVVVSDVRAGQQPTVGRCSCVLRRGRDGGRAEGTQEVIGWRLRRVEGEGGEGGRW